MDYTILQLFRGLSCQHVLVWTFRHSHLVSTKSAEKVQENLVRTKKRWHGLTKLNQDLENSESTFDTKRTPPEQDSKSISIMEKITYSLRLALDVDCGHKQ